MIRSRCAPLRMPKTTRSCNGSSSSKVDRRPSAVWNVNYRTRPRAAAVRPVTGPGPAIGSPGHGNRLSSADSVRDVEFCHGLNETQVFGSALLRSVLYPRPVSQNRVYARVLCRATCLTLRVRFREFLGRPLWRIYSDDKYRSSNANGVRLFLIFNLRHKHPINSYKFQLTNTVAGPKI